MRQSHRKVPLSPRRKAGLLDALSARLDMVSTQLVTMVLPAYVALDAIQRGKGDKQQILALGQFVLFSAFLCKQGWQPDARALTCAAFEALSRVTSHLAEIRWRRVAPLEASVYESVCAALAIFATQMEKANSDRIVQAHTDYLTWVATRTSFETPEGNRLDDIETCVEDGMLRVR